MKLKKILSVLMALIMLVSTLPSGSAQVFAANAKNVIKTVDVGGFVEGWNQAEKLTVPENCGYSVDLNGLERAGDEWDFYYTIKIICSNADTHVFDKSAAVTINGSSDWVDSFTLNRNIADSPDDTIMTIKTKEFHLGKRIGSVELDGYTAPVVGEKPMTAADFVVPDGADYRVSYIELGTPDEPFAAGVDYDARIWLEPTEKNCIFADGCTAAVNGKTVKAETESGIRTSLCITIDSPPLGDYIDAVDFSGFTAPKAGEKAKAKSVITTSCPDVVITDAWWTMSGSTISEDMTFSRGSSYSLHVALETPNDKYIGSSTKLTFGGKELALAETLPIIRRGENKYEIVTADFDLTEHISSVNAAGFVEPRAGANADVVLTDPDRPECVIIDACWVDVDSSEALYGGRSFEDGHGYVLIMTVDAGRGCVIDDELTLTVNGRDDIISYRYETDDGTVFYVSHPYELRKTIDNIEITGITCPQVGEVNSTKARVPSGAGYHVENAQWYDAYSETFMQPGEKFESGGCYAMLVTLRADNGLAFDSENFELTLNKDAVIPDYYSSEALGTVLVAVTETFDFSGRDGAVRLSGEIRQQTAVEISKEAFSGGAENVVIASAVNYADALAGVPLAYALDAPILLVRDSKPDADTLGEIKRLGAKNIYILGGSSVIDANAEKQLSSLGKTIRLAGADRFETAAVIAEKLYEIKGAPAEIFLACSHNYPDALAVGSIAALKGSPVLYIAGDGSISSSLSGYIKKHSVGSACILGGTGAVSADAEKNLKTAGVAKTERFAGEDRYDTCRKINEKYNGLFAGDTVCLATGTNFPDALAGGVFAAVRKAPMLLVSGSISCDQASYLFDLAPTEIYAFGGERAVSTAVINQAIDYAIEANYTDFM